MYSIYCTILCFTFFLAMHLDIDHCVKVENNCLAVPLLIFCGFNACGVIVATLLVVFVSVSYSLNEGALHKSYTGIF